MSKFTKKRIVDSFSKLLGKYSFDDITVTMILKEAEVSKSTFYRYFYDKNDVLDHHFRNIYNEALKSVHVRSVIDLLVAIMRISKSKPEMNKLFDILGYNSYREFVYRYMRDMGKKTLEAGWEREMTEEEEFHVDFFCGGGAKIVEEWTSGKKFAHMNEQQAADEIRKMVNPQYLVVLKKASIL